MKARDVAWKQWKLNQGDREPWLEWEEEAGRVEAENRLLDFIS
jgi:hypothetical protein